MEDLGCLVKSSEEIAERIKKINEIRRQTAFLNARRQEDMARSAILYRDYKYS
jgi:hypothetical protein